MDSRSKYQPPFCLLLICLFLGLQCSTEKVAKAPYFKSFDGITIAFTDEGIGDKVVVLIHGFISNGTSWNKSVLKKQLLEKGYRVIVPDLRGNGKSDKPQKSDAYTNDAEVKDLLALADYLELKKYTAIGYSRGAIVLAKLLTQESRIESAVIGGMGLDFTNPNWDRRLMFEAAFAGTVPLTVETEGAVNYAKSIGADLKILSWLQQHQPVTSIPALEKINTRILVIAGDLDQDNGSPADLQKHFSNSTLKIIAGDHNNTYKALNFADAVIDFLEE